MNGPNDIANIRATDDPSIVNFLKENRRVSIHYLQPINKIPCGIKSREGAVTEGLEEKQ